MPCYISVKGTAGVWKVGIWKKGRGIEEIRVVLSLVHLCFCKKNKRLQSPDIGGPPMAGYQTWGMGGPERLL
jgi:hypothetical protein